MNAARTGSCTNKVHDVPEEIEETVSLHKLASMNVFIDTLTPKQKKYLESWTEGT